jgi:hypothetical protein
MIRWTTREWELIARHLKEHHIEPQHHGWRSAVLAAMRFCLPESRWRAPHSLNESKKILGPLLKQLDIADASAASSKSAINSYGTDELLVELVHRLAHAILDELRPLLKPAYVIEPRLRHDPCPPAAPRPRKPVVLVVGPRSAQQNELKERHSDFLNLRFVASDENFTLIKQRGADADKIILWTNFISHAHQSQAVAMNKDTVYASGGMDTISKVLNRIEV